MVCTCNGKDPVDKCACGVWEGGLSPRTPLTSIMSPRFHRRRPEGAEGRVGGGRVWECGFGLEGGNFGPVGSPPSLSATTSPTRGWRLETARREFENGLPLSSAVLLAVPFI